MTDPMSKKRHTGVGGLNCFETFHMKLFSFENLILLIENLENGSTLSGLRKNETPRKKQDVRNKKFPGLGALVRW